MALVIANTNEADYTNRGQPLEVLRGKVDNRDADYYNRGQPFVGLIITTAVKDMMKSGMIIPFQRI